MSRPKTHCPRGHARTADNLYSNGGCKVCAIAKSRAKERVKPRSKLCEFCGDKFTPSRVTTKYCSKSCMDTAWYHHNIEKERQRGRDKHKRYKETVLKHYGPYCHCPGCSVDTPEFLSIEHVDNDGYAHRKATNQHVYEWLIRNKFPKGYTIFCYNCNCAKGFLGVCPHQRKGLSGDKRVRH